VPMSCMPNMTPTLLVATLVHLQAKSLKMTSLSLKEEKICYKMVY